MLPIGIRLITWYSPNVAYCWPGSVVWLQSILFNNLRQIGIVKCRVKTMVFPSSYVQIWEMDHKEGWALKNWCFWIMVLEKTLESPLDNKEIKPVNAKGNQPWIFLGRTEPEALILWPPDEKSWLIGKDPDAGKDWEQEEKGVIEDEMVEWHHWLNGHESVQTLGDCEGQGSLAFCSPWGHE